MHEYRNTSGKRRVSIKRRPRINIQRLFEADVDIPVGIAYVSLVYQWHTAGYRFHNPHYNQYYLTNTNNVYTAGKNNKVREDH